jgi:hypothetical protein
MQRDIANRVEPAVAVPCQAFASDAATVSSVINVKNFNSVVAHLFTGAVTAGDITITKVEESQTAVFTVAVEVPTSRYWGTPATLDGANESDWIGIDVEMPYLRITVTTDNSADLLAGLNVIKANGNVKDAKKRPATLPS